MAVATSHDPALARMLILDELFDLLLYKALQRISTDTESQRVLGELVTVEAQHLAFWQKFFDSRLTALDIGRRLKLQFMILACRLFGTTGIHLVLEAIEVHGVRKYLSFWAIYKDQPLGNALKGVLMDEFKHEDVLVSQLTERKINRSGSGTSSGIERRIGGDTGRRERFFAAFGDAMTVLIAASTTAVAGSISMAAGAYAALNSEKEVPTTEFLRKTVFRGKDRFANGRPALRISRGGGLQLLPGGAGPGAAGPAWRKDGGRVAAHRGVMTILVSTLLAFLSGMDVGNALRSTS